MVSGVAGGHGALGGMGKPRDNERYGTVDSWGMGQWGDIEREMGH